MNATFLKTAAWISAFLMTSRWAIAIDPVPSECIRGLMEIEKAYSCSEWKYEVVDDENLVCSGFRRSDGRSLQHEFQYVDQPQKVAVFREGSYFQLRKENEDWVPRKLQPMTMKHERFGPSYLEDTYEFDHIPIRELLTRNQESLSVEDWRILSHQLTEDAYVVRLGRNELRHNADLYLQPKKNWVCEKILLNLDSRISAVEITFVGEINGVPALSELRKVVDEKVVRKASYTPISNSPDKAVFTLRHYGLSEDLLRPKGMPSNSHSLWATMFALLGVMFLVTALVVRSKRSYRR